MPADKPTPGVALTEVLVLAAIERAERHRHPEREPGIPLYAIKEHLGLDLGGWSTRRLRPQLERLEHDRQIQRRRLHGHPVWQLTKKGQKHLATSGTSPELPEAPQHRRWREAREAAKREIGPLLTETSLLVAEAAELTQTGRSSPSDAWVNLGRRLGNAFAWVGSARYCLTEWPEPDDATTDLEHGRLHDILPWAKSRTGPGETGR